MGPSGAQCGGLRAIGERRGHVATGTRGASGVERDGVAENPAGGVWRCGAKRQERPLTSF